MSKRHSHRAPALSDWHLWTEVKRTVSPLRPEVAPEVSRGDEPLPLPALKQPPVFAGKPKWEAQGAQPPFVPEQAGAKKAQFPAGRIIEPRVKRRLMRGQIEIEGTIDLHGMRQSEAHAALHRFVLARSARGDRTILVITGKGIKKLDDTTIVERGVLRAMLPIWLSEPGLAPLVAGWDAAAQGHGGEGAFYVRLKRGAS